MCEVVFSCWGVVRLLCSFLSRVYVIYVSAIRPSLRIKDAVISGATVDTVNTLCAFARAKQPRYPLTYRS